MRHSVINGQEPSFQKLLIFSFILHLVLISILFIQFRTQRKEFKSYYVSLVEPSRGRSGRAPVAVKSGKSKVAKSRIAVKKKAVSGKKAVTKEKKVATRKNGREIYHG